MTMATITTDHEHSTARACNLCGAVNITRERKEP
jgi:hypothetical protein